MLVKEYLDIDGDYCYGIEGIIYPFIYQRNTRELQNLVKFRGSYEIYTEDEIKLQFPEGLDNHFKRDIEV